MSRTICLLVVICLLFTSCTGITPFQDNLLRPPRLTEEQKEIEDALFSSVSSSDLTFKYPKSGQHRSAFIFQDIDGDGREEALVFYVTGISDSTFLSVLARTPEGKWQSPTSIAGAEENVDFISFANLTDTNRCDILVGWSDTSGQQKRLNIYSFIDNKLVSRFSGGPQSYETYLTTNLDNEPLSELVLLSRDISDRSTQWIHLFAFDGSNIKLMDDFPLSEYMSECKGLTAGRFSLSDSRIGIFVDEAVDEEIVTEVFVCETPKAFKAIIWESMAAPATLATKDENEATVDTPTLYDLTRRSTKTDICNDVNGDNIIEIPTGRIMPGYEEYDTADSFYLTQYKRLQDNTLVDVFSAALHREGGYRVKFPVSWIDHVTIVNQMENNEWRFIEYNSQLLNNPLEDWSSELMRIRIVSQKDYQDKSIENYTVLAVRGSFTYYGYIPETAISSLSITMDQLQNEIFSLIERKGVFET